MSTIKRRLRGGREGGSMRLTDLQHDELLFGFSLFAPGRLQNLDNPAAKPQPSTFATPGDKRAAWKQHRAALLIEAGAGRRPHAYYTLDLRITAPYGWAQELGVLMDMGVIVGPEIIEVEIVNRLLSPTVNTDLAASFEHPLMIAALADRATLRHVHAEVSVAARWHAWRNRPALAGVFAARATKLAELLDAAA